MGDFEISQLKGHLKSKSNQMTKVWQRPIRVIINKRVIAVNPSRINHDESFGQGINKNSDKGQSMVQKKIRLILKVNESQSSLWDKSNEIWMISK